MIRASNPRNREDWNTICKIATEREEVLGALQLVHDEYARSELSLPSRSGVRVTRYHLLDSTEILVGIANGDVVSTLSLVRDSRFGLPLESIYPEEVQSRRRLGKKLVEVSCLADRRSDADRTLDVMFRMFALAFQSQAARGVHEAFIAVHPRHGKFYQRFLGFVPVGGLKTYSFVRGNPAVALRLDLTRVHETDPKAYKRMCGNRYSSSELRRRTVSLDLLEELSWLYKYDEEANNDGYGPLVPLAEESASVRHACMA